MLGRSSAWSQSPRLRSDHDGVVATELRKDVGPEAAAYVRPGVGTEAGHDADRLAHVHGRRSELAVDIEALFAAPSSTGR